jgi:hypothetical protein
MDLQQIAEMLSQMKADQAKAEANREARLTLAEANMQQIVAELKADRDTHVQEIVAKIDANQERLEARVRSIRYEQDEKIRRRSENVTVRQEIPKEGAAVESLERGPKEVESEVERREVPTEEAAVKSSRVMKKRSRGRRTAAGRRVNPTKLIRGDGESRKKLVAACRKVSCCAAVAWRKRNLVSDIRTQRNGGPRQDLGAAGIMVTLRAKLARRNGTFAGKNQTRNKAGRRASRQPFGKRCWRYSECNNGIRNQNSRQQLVCGRRGQPRKP